MKAILPVTEKNGEKITEKMMLFDTETAKKVCGVKNSFGNTVEEVYLGPNGTLFLYDIKLEKIKTWNEKDIEKYIGENYPDKYEEIFRKVEEA